MLDAVKRYLSLSLYILNPVTADWQIVAQRQNPAASTQLLTEVPSWKMRVRPTYYAIFGSELCLQDFVVILGVPVSQTWINFEGCYSIYLYRKNRG